jgi:large subunit ribosomal protein LP2
MRYVAAYLLAALGGNEHPTAENIEKILSSVGIEAESDKLKKVIAELKGKNLQTLIAEGKIGNIFSCQCLMNQCC